MVVDLVIVLVSVPEPLVDLILSQLQIFTNLTDLISTWGFSVELSINFEQGFLLVLSFAFADYFFALLAHLLGSQRFSGTFVYL